MGETPKPPLKAEEASPMMDASEPREDHLRRRLVAPLGGKARSEHPDPDLVAAHAAGELSPEFGLAITRHLTVCDDGRCAAVLRDAITGAAVARASLYGRTEGSLSEAPPPDLDAGGVETPEAAEEALTVPPPAAMEEPPQLAAVVAPEPGVRARVFECDDELWEAFAAAAGEQGRTVDQLLDEAMQAYARQRSEDRASQEAPHPARPHALAMPRDVTLHESPRERNTPTLPRAYLPRAPAASRRATPHPVPLTDRLSVVIEGVRYEVTKERFVVGRGGRASDLAIDDPGVSRQHALIERAGGAYYLVDMGSTNGVEYQGERIARKEIAHGDRFRIGDHELEFLYG
jgi:predicted component of type VI protein secretion system